MKVVVRSKIGISIYLLTLTYIFHIKKNIKKRLFTSRNFDNKVVECIFRTPLYINQNSFFLIIYQRFCYVLWKYILLSVIGLDKVVMSGAAKRNGKLTLLLLKFHKSFCKKSPLWESFVCELEQSENILRSGSKYVKYHLIFDKFFDSFRRV